MKIKLLLLPLLIALAALPALSTPSIASADHVWIPPSPCKTVRVYGWYNGGPAAIMVYAFDHEDMVPVMDGTPLPVTGRWGSGLYEYISFKLEPYVWITEVDFDHVGPHKAHVTWHDCKPG